ncbi:ABC transporter substrate-binding protein [Saliphagus sp. GCM10025308]
MRRRTQLAGERASPPLFAAQTSNAGRLAISFEEYDGSSAAASAVAAGDVDLGVAGAATVLRERALGRPIVPVGVLFPRSTAVIYATREAFGGPFDRIGRLRGGASERRRPRRRNCSADSCSSRRAFARRSKSSHSRAKSGRR